jgi:hypothetical protein
MATTQNSGKGWTQDEVEQLKKLVGENTPTSLIAMKLERTEAAVQSKAVKEGISLKPVNRSPYG